MTEKKNQRNLATRCIRLAVCIVSVFSSASTRADEGLGLATIARWDFGSEEDSKADRWPDGWTRLKDFRHPGFIPVQIDRKTSLGLQSAEAEQIRRTLAKLYLGLQTQRSPWEIIPETIPDPIEKFVEHTLVDPYLRIDMDGGAAEVYSPKIAADDNSLYGLQVDIYNDSPDFEAIGRLRFLDRSGALIFQTETASLEGGVTTWAATRSPGSYDAPIGVAAIQVALTVKAKSPQATRAVIGFDRIRVLQMPKIRLSLDHPTHLYRPKEQATVKLFASGLLRKSTRVNLLLYDHEGEIVAQDSKLLENSQMVAIGRQDQPQSASRWEGTCEWILDPLPPGYYEIVTSLERSSTVFVQNRETFAVIAESSNPALDPRFGWSFDERVLDWRIEQLIALVREGGTGYIKIPIWFDTKDLREQEALSGTIDRLQATGIRCVGVIDRPMSNTRVSTDTASALEDPSVWQPQLEPVFRSMCMRLVDFQIGRDQDTQYGSNPRYEPMLQWIKKILRRYGTEPTVTLARNPWLNPFQSKLADRWQWFIEESISESEWPHAMGNLDSRYPDWTCITPASAEKYSLSTRTKDLAARMIASMRPRNGRVTTGWVREPFSNEVGFLASDGAPREMFVPYRILLDAIKKREFAGQIDMDGGSRNALLVSENDSRLILWSSSPTTEQIYLGDQMQAIDTWGRRVEIDRIETPFGPEYQIQLNKWPVILEGIDSKLAIWRMGLAMDQQRLDSLIGLPQKLQVRFKNPFSFPVSGRIDLVAPNVFENETESSPFDVGPNSEITIPIEVLLRPDATAQDTPVRVVVSLNTSPAKQFSVSRNLRIGNDEVEFETAYRINENDELWLDLDAINHTNHLTNFDCQLFIPDRRNERIQITSVETRKTKTIVIPRASELIDKTIWLRCNQIGTRRILNYRIIIEPESKPESPLDQEINP